APPGRRAAGRKLERRVRTVKKLMLVIALAALCIPAAALGKKPPARSTALAAKNAAWACKALQLRMGRPAFLAAYGQNRNARDRDGHADAGLAGRHAPEDAHERHVL